MTSSIVRYEIYIDGTPDPIMSGKAMKHDHVAHMALSISPGEVVSLGRYGSSLGNFIVKSVDIVKVGQEDQKEVKRIVIKKDKMDGYH